MQNLGESTVHTKTEEGTVRDITFQNVKLDLPILSTRCQTADGSVMLYGHGSGLHLDPMRGTADKFVAHGGVYFQKIYFPKALTGDPLDFVRPGAAA